MKTLGEALEEMGSPRYCENVPWKDWWVVALEGEADYQGDVEFIARDPNNADRFVKYGWSFGSCSGCDSWESSGASEAEITDEMLKDAVFYDDASLNILRIMLREVQDPDAYHYGDTPRLVDQIESYMRGEGYAAS